MKKELEEISQANLYRKLPNHHLMDEKIIASSNNYLGLAQDEQVIQAAKDAISIYGTSSTGSRLTTGNLEIHEQLEKELASFKKTDACLLFSSGYLANLGVITTLTNKDTIVFSDEFNHASIIDACRLSRAEVVVYKHNNIADLTRKLERYKNHANKVIVSDGVFSMDGDLAPLDQLDFLKEKYQALLVIDDAHGTGVIGSTGRGTSEYFSIIPDVIVGTLSKAFGSEGGFVCANKNIIEFLIQKSRPFIFQTSLSPGNVGAALKSLDLMQTQKRHQILQEKVADLRNFLTEEKFNVPEGITPIIPIIFGSNEKTIQMQNQLDENGVFIPAIRPPTVPINMSRLRCTIQATHSHNDLKHIKHAFSKLSRN